MPGRAWPLCRRCTAAYGGYELLRDRKAESNSKASNSEYSKYSLPPSSVPFSLLPDFVSPG